jgi:hypothetical protein
VVIGAPPDAGEQNRADKQQDIAQPASIGASRSAQPPVSIGGSDQVVDTAIDAALQFGSPLNLFRW